MICPNCDQEMELIEEHPAILGEGLPNAEFKGYMEQKWFCIPCWQFFKDKERMRNRNNANL